MDFVGKRVLKVEEDYEQKYGKFNFFIFIIV